MDLLSSFVPSDRRAALAGGLPVPATATGSVLLTDLSGFTTLAERLGTALGPQRGADTLGRLLDQIFAPLVAAVARYEGHVIGFAGDALTAWFPADAGLRAVAAALEQQAALPAVRHPPLPDSHPAPITLRAAIATGTVHRFLAGDPAIQVFDMLTGAPVGAVGAAIGQMAPGLVVIDSRTAAALGPALRLAPPAAGDPASPYRVVTGLHPTAGPPPLEAAPPPPLLPTQARPWLLPAVWDGLAAGAPAFLAEIRPVVALFLQFPDLPYAQDPAAALDAYIRQVQATLAVHEGALLNLTLGDKGSYLYAAFGAPLAHADDVTRALAAAQALRQPPPWGGAVALGLHRGQVWAGAYGGSARRTYSTLGAAVNLAARLMQAAAPGQVLVSAALAVGPRYPLRPLPPLRVKGVAAPVPVSELAATAPPSALGLTEPLYHQPLVGRAAELAQVDALLAQAQAGQGQILLIQGESGLGKSRLVAEVIRRATAAGFGVYGGASQANQAGPPYRVWQPIWRAFFGLPVYADGARPGEEVAAQTILTAALRALDPALLPRLPLLGAVLALALPDTDLTLHLDAPVRKEVLEGLLVACLRARLAAASLLLVLEDCHWLDPLSVDLLAAVGAALADRPGLLVLTSRTADPTAATGVPLAQQPFFTPLRLPPLESGAAAALAARQLGVDRADPRIAALLPRLIARAEGNPFYLEELVHYLQTRGLDLAQPQPLADTDLPASLHGLILGRIDQLTPAQKTVLRVASVIGRTFRAGWLGGAYPDLAPAGTVEAALGVLQERDLTLLDGAAPERTYLFKHALIQEVAYESLPYSLRSELHERLAAWLEAQPEAVGPELLAYHYGHSANRAKHAEYCQTAGDAAAAVFAPATARAYYQQALAGLPAGPSRARRAVLAGLGAVYHRQGDLGAALETYQVLQGEATAAGDRRAAAQAWNELAFIQDVQGDFPAARASVEQALALTAGDAALAHERAVALERRGWAHYRQREFAAARGLGAEAVALNRHLGAEVPLADGLRLLAVATELLDARQAAGYIEQALALYRSLGHVPGICDALNLLGIMAEERDDYHGAAQHFAAALAEAQRIGYRALEALFLNNLGDVLVALGDYGGAERVIRPAIAAGQGLILLEAYSGLAAALLGQGRAVEAQEPALAALACTRRASQPTYEARAWRVLGQIAAALAAPVWVDSRPYTAGACFAESVRLATAAGARREHARTLAAWASLAAAEGDAAGAARYRAAARRLLAGPGAGAATGGGN